MQALRTPCDKLEAIVDKQFWPFPTYEDLMFEV
jgi:glutamine synthetase